jgi:hypothetical protein
VKNAQYMIDEDTYGKEVRRNPGLLLWLDGRITAGATLVEATQNSRNFTGAAALVRAIPTVTWLDPRTAPLVDFTGAYGSVTQPGTTGRRPTSFTAMRSMTGTSRRASTSWWMRLLTTITRKA